MNFKEYQKIFALFGEKPNITKEDYEKYKFEKIWKELEERLEIMQLRELQGLSPLHS